jgi:hypothetical protein
MWDAPLGGPIGPLGGGGPSCLCEGHIYFEGKIKAEKIYIFIGTLLV